MTYKSFRIQMKECRENENLFIEKCITWHYTPLLQAVSHKLIMCKKYGGQCISKKCLGERTNNPNLVKASK